MAFILKVVYKVFISLEKHPFFSFIGAKFLYKGGCTHPGGVYPKSGVLSSSREVVPHVGIFICFCVSTVNYSQDTLK